MHEEPIDSLVSRGFDCLDDQDYEEAIQIGEEILSKRHSSAFEILALAYAGLGDTERAVRTLEDGIAKVPTVWKLWGRLGNFRAELGQFTEAQEAYQKALDCPGVDCPSIQLNRSTALVREGRFDEALEALDEIKKPELQRRIESHRLDIQIRQGRYEQVIERGRQLMPLLAEQGDEDVLARVLVLVGSAYWKGRKDKAQALEYAWKALEHEDGVDQALWLIRAVDSKSSGCANYYRLVVKGDWHEQSEEGKALSFGRHFEVVADDPTEALAYARSFEPEEVRASLVVLECDILEERCAHNKGVYSFTGHVVFEAE